MATASNEMLDTLLGMDDTRRAEILQLMAGSDSAKLEALVSDVENQKEKRAAAIKRKAEEAEKKARNEAIEAVTVRVQAFDATEDSYEDLETLFDEVLELKGLITVDGFNDGLPTFTVHGLTRKTGGNKKGRPSKTTPTDFTDTEGNRVFGAITDWARANLSEEILNPLLKEVDSDFDHEKKKVPFKLAGANLAAKLVKDGHLVEDVFVPLIEDSESDSEDAAEDNAVEATTDSE